MNIRKKLLLSVFASVVLVFAGLSLLSYRYSRKAMVGEIERRAEGMIRSYTWELDANLQSIQAVAMGLSIASQSLVPASEEELEGLIKNSLEAERRAFGATVAFEPGEFPGAKTLIAPYYRRGPEGLLFVDLGTSTYDYPKWDWYRIPRESGKPRWSEPYIDVGGGEVAMTTFSCPFFRNGKVWGVATADVALQDLTADIENIKTGETGYAFLLSKEGKFLTMRSKEWRLKRTIFDVAMEWKSEDIKKLGEEMLAGKEGFISTIDPMSGEKTWFVYGTVPSTGWSLAIAFPEGELLGELNSLHRTMIITAAAAAVVIFLLIFVISSRLAEPIRRLAMSARRISEGDFTRKPEGSSGSDEVGVLTRAFTDMERSLVASLEKLRDEKEMFRTCFSEMSDGLVILGAGWNVVQSNTAADRLLLLPAQRPFLQYLMEHFDTSVPLDRISDFSRRLPPFELSRRDSEDMEPLDLTAIITPVHDEAGALRALVLSVRDVTKLRSEESSKKNFLSMISYKLMVPVNALQSSVEMLKDKLLGSLSEKQQRHVDAMGKESARLAGLIEKLIGFVAIEGADLESSRERIDLPALFKEIADEARLSYADMHPEIETKAAFGAGEIDFNRGYLRLAIGQLLDNALKFNLNNPAHATIECTREGKSFAISVADDGVGIPPEYLDRIFDKFYQIEKYSVGGAGGMGLGLTFVRRIIEHFGGRIDVVSTPGSGSKFTIRLPAA
ncbi:MAG: ATP-binding protein [Pseudomonadota bacterium]